MRLSRIPLAGDNPYDKPLRVKMEPTQLNVRYDNQEMPTGSAGRNNGSSNGGVRQAEPPAAGSVDVRRQQQQQPGIQHRQSSATCGSATPPSMPESPPMLRAAAPGFLPSMAPLPAPASNGMGGMMHHQSPMQPSMAPASLGYC